MYSSGSVPKAPNILNTYILPFGAGIIFLILAQSVYKM